MKARALLLADGPSDEPLGQHVARMAQRHGCELDIVTPDLSRLDQPPGLRVADRLQTVLEFDDAFDLVVVHRDAERQDPRDRHQEIADGVADVRQGMPSLPIVPIKMTEAWLLVDETAIRRAAGAPDSRRNLHLPKPNQVEAVSDPKKTLEDALIRASGLKGRRLKAFKRDFGGQRRRLLEWLDHGGPVAKLAAWKTLESSIQDVIGELK